MPRRHHTPPPELLRAPFGLALADELISRRQLEHNYTRVFRGGWSAAAGELSFIERMAALRAAVGPEPVWAGLSAAVALGADVAARSAPLELVLARANLRRSRPGALIRGMALSADEVEPTPFGKSLSPLRTALDLATRPLSPLAVARVDQVMRVGSLTAEDLAREVAARPGMRGIRTARTMLELVEPLSESIPESLLRLGLVELGLPRPTAQLTLLDEAGLFIARLDLGWREARVGLEYDGAHHREDATHSRDLLRHNRIRAAGWTVYQVDHRLARRLEDVAALIRRHLR